MACAADMLSDTLLEALLKDSGGQLTLLGLEDLQAAALADAHPRLSVTIEPQRNQFDYLYRRSDLATLQGGLLKAKRNHVNRFRAEHPDFEYRPLSPALFDECRRLTTIWQEEKDSSG